ncbi:hypothetical protein F5887DRAFT_110223 [Amanita rubescens]|nr:hypothetical protein F5887DRAFT_110223 [Amanita rubescens]
MISSTSATVITLSVQGFLYGTYDATLFHCLRFLVYDENQKRLKSRSINWPLLSITLFNFILSTSYLGISCRIAFASLANEEVVVDQFINVSHSIANGTMLITDAGLIYYCHKIFFRCSPWRITILPIMLWFANIVFSVFQICWTVIRLFNSNALWVCPRLRYIQLAFYSCSIAITFYTTFAIIYRFCIIYYVMRESHGDATRHPLFSLCRVFAESGISYTLTRVLNLITTSSGLEPQLLKCLFNVLNFSVACIMFNLIQIRMKQRQNNRQSPPISPMQFQSVRMTYLEEDTGKTSLSTVAML